MKHEKNIDQGIRLNGSNCEVKFTRKSEHCFIIGGSGCGMTRAFIRPNTEQINGSDCELIITDPAGEAGDRSD